MCEEGTCHVALRREYEQAVEAKIAAGPEHENDPDCECEVCDAERELYFILKHAHDDDNLRITT